MWREDDNKWIMTVYRRMTFEINDNVMQWMRKLCLSEMSSLRTESEGAIEASVNEIRDWEVDMWEWYTSVTIPAVYGCVVYWWLYTIMHLENVNTEADAVVETMIQKPVLLARGLLLWEERIYSLRGSFWLYFDGWLKYDIYRSGVKATIYIVSVLYQK